uniref:Uncharacterized protein n=1 Tax=Arundo donax TaxID=35708 RepID=A0A0A9CDM8_ARUDO
MLSLNCHNTLSDVYSRIELKISQITITKNTGISDSFFRLAPQMLEF